ncbi:hypothetical protein ZIOFF_036492 [Zingiber officinale]|uniref:BHLH domain-containing protein n=1 Tax=Zingiber officinale TaxID=94328 RepID=A0A8J5L8M9_ZINOF|nr:hypothetical protein ZIOFF_036492 [Zingiber officinale]
MSSWSSDRLPQCFPNFKWSRSVDPAGQFGSVLGSLMSSQSPSLGFGFGKPGLGLQRAAIPNEFDSSKLGQLTAASDLAPGFSERAARVFRFEGENGLRSSDFELNSTISQSLMANGFQLEQLESNSQTPGPKGMKLEMKTAELGICREETSMSDTISASREASLGGHGGSNARKRKARPKSKEKEAVSMVADEEDCFSKRHRQTENNAEIGNASVRRKIEQSNDPGNDEHKLGKPSDPPKDYIHVRARRGQATDSHSLAERVRREKISQRMKLLQDLVPGCSKVTGKAVMLDEIINYVQSLQRQVEFLSMKLATVNPDIDFNNLMNLQPKHMIQIFGAAPSSVYPFEMMPQQSNPLACIVTDRMNLHSSINTLDFNAHHQPCINGYENISSQLGAFWEDDFQSVVQIGIGQSQEIVSSMCPSALQLRLQLVGWHRHPDPSFLLLCFPLLTEEQCDCLSVVRLAVAFRTVWLVHEDEASPINLHAFAERFRME